MRVFQQVDVVQEGGFVGVGRVENGDDVVVFGCQGNVFEHFEVVVVFVQVADFQCGCCFGYGV